MNTIVNNVLQKYLNNDKIIIPKEFTKVNIDIGTSHNAPYSEYWLNKDSELCVFAFEPNKYNIEFLTSIKQISGPKYNLNYNRVDKSFFLIEAALSNKEPHYQKFYCTEHDSGCSSLFKPTQFEVKDMTKVPVIRLKDFFDLFPWNQIPYIDLLKIDAQGSDFDIILGAEDYLKNNIATLIVETTTNNQYNNNENQNDFKDFIESNNFVCEKWASDGQFYNKKFENIAKTIDHRAH